MTLEADIRYLYGVYMELVKTNLGKINFKFLYHM